VPQPSIDELILAEESERWRELGFAVEGDVCRLAGVSVRLAGAQAGRGILGWSLRDVSSTELDGLPTTISAQPVPPTAPPHGNGIVGIDHIVAMSPAFERSVAALTHAGLDLRRVREEPTPAGAPRQAFFRLGAEILELVAEPEEVVAAGGGPERPTRFWGLALLSEDIEHTAALLGEHCGEVRAAVQPGRRVATVRRSAGLSLPIALMSPTQPTGASA
jgi:hypothetical protein